MLNILKILSSRIGLALLSLIMVTNIQQIHAQSVGLVLSGGGAKGIAHIGVIKVLEDNNIPIDYVAGTSIGAIIAGLYASGYSPEEMLQLFNSDDFKLWSTGKMDKDDLYYFKRKDESPEWIKIDISKKEDKLKLILPINLVPEGQMDFAFMQLMAQNTAVCKQNFDSLLVPFRCVSTDIYNNTAIVHKNGNLSEAIRASMTFPMVYKPIELNGKLLFDGGIANNFPIDVMIDDFKPDFIIGHKVVEDNENPDPEDLFKQIETMVMLTTNYSVPDSNGVLLETHLTDVNLLDFAKTNYIYSRGVETAKDLIDSLSSRITRRVSKDVVTQKRAEFNAKKPPLKFKNVQVEGVQDNLQRNYLIQSIKAKEDTFSIKEFRNSYFKLVADEHIKSIRPLARYNSKTGYFDASLKVTPRKPFDVEFGGHLSTAANTFGYIEANYKAFKKRLYNITTNIYFGQFYNSFMAGGRMDSPSKNPFYFAGSFAINRWDYLATSTDIIFTDVRPTYVIQQENNIRLEAGYPYSKTGVIDFGLAQSTTYDNYFQVKENIIENDEYDQTKLSSYIAHISISKKNFNYKIYPTEGSNRLFQFKYINSFESFTPGTKAPTQSNIYKNHNYVEFKAKLDQYFPIGKYLTIGVLYEAVFNNNSLLSNYTSTLINAPAFTPTPNSKGRYLEEYRANEFMAFGGKAIYNVNGQLHFRLEAYGFVPFEQIQIKEEFNNEGFSTNIPYKTEQFFHNYYLSGLAAAVLQTQFGPLSAEVNYYQKNGQRLFFSVNMGFMIYNKRGNH